MFSHSSLPITRWNKLYAAFTIYGGGWLLCGLWHALHASHPSIYKCQAVPAELEQ